jgi:DNA polymerase II small subunit
MIRDKRITKNKNIIFEVEDLTGKTKVLINFAKHEIFEKCKNILLDEVVAFNVSGNKEMLFANDVIFPDATLSEKKKIQEDISVAFISDIHVGSSMFLEERFLEFIKWLDGTGGTEEQKKIAKKIKYLFIVGDTIDGVGVFPEQEKLLKISDTLAQYKKLSELLNLIRKDIEIIICPGQHDAVWVGEPQPTIGSEWAPALYNMENVTLVTNPCLLEIENTFKILMYHGASLHSIVLENSDIRLNYGHNSPTIIVKELLKRRHLAPIHGICDYIPHETRDPLVINIVPDIIATGDLHRPEVSTYNNILLIASSCWQSLTPFEEKVGNNPDPCKVPVFNFKTREVKILDFSAEPQEKEITKEAEEINSEKTETGGTGKI